MVITPTVITPNAIPQPNGDHTTSYLDAKFQASSNSSPTQSNNDNAFYSTVHHDASSIDEWGVNNDSSLEEHRQVYSTVNHDDSLIDEWGVKKDSSLEEHCQVNAKSLQHKSFNPQQASATL